MEQQNNKTKIKYKSSNIKPLDIKIIIAAHKKYRMPQDDIYLPIHVGAEGKAPIDIRAIIQAIISPPSIHTSCELTGMY